jgi:quercetin dioxygenase-like cupin family protein
VNRLTVVAAALIISVVALAGDKKDKPALAVQQADIKWSQPYGPQGPAFGFVIGTFGDKNPASFFIKFGAGGDSGWHIHDNDYEAVVLKGTMTAQQQGEAAEKQLPPGSFFTQPGKQNHRNGCLKDTGDCLLFVRFDRGANTTPTTPEGKLVTQAK